MDTQHLQELIDLDDSYWWHIAKRKLVVDLVTDRFPAPRPLIEGGIGSAKNLLTFQEAGYRVTGFDIMADSVRHAREQGLKNVHQHDLCKPWPVDDKSASVVVLLDVLEHLSDPVAVLKDVFRVLRPGGAMVFTVPANQWMYGDWDRQLGHHRRYTVSELRRQAEEADLRVEWISYWNAFSMPAAVAVRGYQRLFPKPDRGTDFPRVGSFVNRMLLGAAATERLCMRATILPFGLSLVGILRK